jgi:hypothetical protein
MLRNTLLYLRQALGDVESSHLIVDRQALGFDFSSDFDHDLRTVEAAFARTRAPVEKPAPTGEERGHLLAQLQDAVAAYRGSFLEGFSSPMRQISITGYSSNVKSGTSA